MLELDTLLASDVSSMTSRRKATPGITNINRDGRTKIEA